MDNTNAITKTIADDGRRKLICTAQGFEYIPDPLRHIYGKSERPPLESMFLTELSFFNQKYPGYEIFTLGSSLVFGEKFITYLTICEFDIKTEEDFINLKEALWESDQAIRKKFHALWKWDMAARSQHHIVFMVGHLDLADFLHHRQEFKTKAHSRYMSSFISPGAVIESHDYKVLHDGTIVPFDENLLDEQDRYVFDNYQKIKFETIEYKMPQQVEQEIFND